MPKKIQYMENLKNMIRNTRIPCFMCVYVTGTLNHHFSLNNHFNYFKKLTYFLFSMAFVGWIQVWYISTKYCTRTYLFYKVPILSIRPKMVGGLANSVSFRHGTNVEFEGPSFVGGVPVPTTAGPKVRRDILRVPHLWVGCLYQLLLVLR